MSKVCALSNKKPQTGHNVSHSERKTKRRYLPNISKKKVTDPATGKTVKIKISTRAQRTLTKNPAKYAKAFKKILRKKGI
ncbi:50S ribosomal protein L28 [Candidatus Gracilibacteria bacterium]|nr:50S ribosomal protein L28 [Candidatus Gracilibacteria bacterium]